MADFTEETLIDIGDGLLIPKLANRWRMTITDRVPIINEIKSLLVKQIVAFKFNYHLQLIELTIEQNANNNHLHTLVKQLSKLSKLNKYNDINFVIEELDGAGGVTGRFMFSACKLVDHDYNLDYANSNTCRHWLKFSFKETQELS